MQSTTTGTLTGTESYGPCMVSIGRWAYTDPNLLANTQLAQQAQNLYSEIYGIYLQTSAETTAVSVRAVRAVQPTTTTRQQRRRTTQTGVAATTRQRVRTPAGTPGASDAKVLAVIVANPNIEINGLRANRSMRGVTPNIVGTSISRLLKGGYIAGTPKIGPFSATPTGINAARQQPTSIGAARARQAASSRGRAAQPTAAEPTAATA